MQGKLSGSQKNMKKVNIALIGAGGMANGVHYPSLRECEDVNLVGLCDLVPSKLQATAERFEIDQTFTDYRQMLEKNVSRCCVCFDATANIYSRLLSTVFHSNFTFLLRNHRVLRSIKLRRWASAAEKKTVVKR